jgi:hypothetical protein
MEDAKKVAEAMKDKEFVKELQETKSAEEAQTVFKKKGLTFSVAELKELRAALKKQAGGKLDDDELKSVAGGASDLFNPSWLLVAYGFPPDLGLKWPLSK